MVPIYSVGRKNCSLDVFRMMTEGTGISLRGGERNADFRSRLG